MSSNILAVWNILVLLAACYFAHSHLHGNRNFLLSCQKKKSGVIAVILAALFFTASSLLLRGFCDFIMDW